MCYDERYWTMKRQSSKKGSRKRGQFTPRVELSDGSAYSGQQKVVLRLEGTPSLLSTTVATGVIANAIGIDSTQITGFAARFGATFDEYRVLGADFKITPVSASTGVSKFFFDEKASGNPTANEAQERNSVPLANTNAMASSRRTMRWRAKDLLDLQYIATNSTATVAYFKTYTNSATWGAPTAVTALWLVEPTLICEFRGIKST